MRGYACAGSRVNSRTYVPEKHYQCPELSDLNTGLLEAIPYWPETVDLLDLAKWFRITPKSVDRRLGTLQEDHLIFQDGNECSRFRTDLSNVEAR